MYNTHTCFHKRGSSLHYCCSQAKIRCTKECSTLPLFTRACFFSVTSIKTRHGFSRLPAFPLKQDGGKLNAYKQILWSDKRRHLLLTDLLPAKVCERLVIEVQLHNSSGDLSSRYIVVNFCFIYLFIYLLIYWCTYLCIYFFHILLKQFENLKVTVWCKVTLMAKLSKKIKKVIVFFWTMQKFLGCLINLLQSLCPLQ